MSQKTTAERRWVITAQVRRGKSKENGMQDVCATEHIKKSEATARAGKESLSKTAN